MARTSRPRASRGDRSPVIVIGAGAAGLAAASCLHDAGVSVIVVDARARVGGRIFTVRDARSSTPVELGAEFVHGRADALQPWLHAADVRTVDVAGTRWQARGGRLQRVPDYWEQLDRVMRRVPSLREGDRSFAAFLASRPGGREMARERQLARKFVEGFHAADVGRIGVHALAAGGSPGTDVRERRLGRVVDGYDCVLVPAATRLGPRIRLSSVVTAIVWGGGLVRVHLRSRRGVTPTPLAGRAALITVPLGVLQARPPQPGAIRFDPPIDEKTEALDSLAMGTATRVVVQLRRRFWADERLAKRLRTDDLDQLSFLHTADQVFGTVWTLYPVVEPRIVAWCGGPAARDLSGLGPRLITERVLQALGAAFGRRPRTLARDVRAVWTHDWIADPFARGAYSYQLTGGEDATRVLARPVDGTLFFAGEATDTSGNTGTVHGALASGARAAAQVLHVLRHG